MGKSEGDDVVKVWPDEARAAALEGRRGKKYPGNPAREGSDAARRDGEARTVWDARHGVAVVTKPKPKAKSEDDVVKVWSPESRAAALEARRRNARGQSGKVPFGRQNVKANSAALEQYGWKQVTDPGTAMFDFQTFEHSKYPGHQITMSNKDGRWNAGKDPKPGGEGWTPVGGGKGSIKTYLDSFSTYTPKDKEDGKMKSQRPPGPRVVEDDEDVVKVWSDASRAAAAEARRRGARRQGAGVLTPREPVRPSQKPGYRYKPGPGGLRPPRPTRFDPSNLP